MNFSIILGALGIVLAFCFGAAAYARIVRHIDTEAVYYILHSGLIKSPLAVLLRRVIKYTAFALLCAAMCGGLLYLANAHWLGLADDAAETAACLAAAAALIILTGLSVWVFGRRYLDYVLKNTVLL